MEVDYGPALPPRLGTDHPHDNASDEPSSLSDEPSKVPSVRPKNILTLTKRHDTEPRPASDQYSCQSEEPRVASSRPKKHADKSKYKVRSRYLSSLSEEDQSSACKHRSSKPLGLFLTKTNHNTIQTLLIIGK